MAGGTVAPTGIPVDRSGGPTVDPTKNVLDLVNAAVTRIDDLRESETKRVDERIAMLESSIEKQLALRGAHFTELADKESSRLDSIRQVDVLNQAAAAKSALDAIQALASTTTINADNIRNALTTTAAQMAKQTTDLAAAIATQSAATTDAMTVRIAALEKASAEGVGKMGVRDPMLDQLLVEMRSLNQSRAAGEGAGTERAEGRTRSQWSIGLVVAIAFGILSFLIGVTGLVITIMKFTGN